MVKKNIYKMKPSFTVKFVLGVLSICLVVGFWFVYSEIYTAEAQISEKVKFKIESGESVFSVAARLEEEQVIRNSFLFRSYLKIKNLDTKINHGEFEVESPITLSRVVEALQNPSSIEQVITIIPGWDLRDISEYLIESGVGQVEIEELDGSIIQNRIDKIIGKPATDYRWSKMSAPKVFDYLVLKSKPDFVSYEGYFRPDTYRIFKDATLEQVFEKLIRARNQEFTRAMYTDIEKSGRTVHEILTMASLIEREVMSQKDKSIVSDIFWKRHDVGMGLQADSSVHYATGKKGEVFTTKEERDSKNIWNTYKYPKLPPGPISSPSLESIMAAIYPDSNDYWYFLTTIDTGEAKYAKTLEQHNRNVQKFIRQ